MEYSEFNHPDLKTLLVSACYICGDPLSEDMNRDHIIPNSMFPNGAGRRPKLPVHKDCNSGKSMVDERIKMRILLMSSLNPIAGDKLAQELLIPANQQRELLGLVGANRTIRDYKLARTLGRDLSKRADIVSQGEPLVELLANDTHTTELNEYLASMARGLFIRNVSGANPAMPSLRYIDRRVLRLQGKDVARAMKPIFSMIGAAKENNTLFGQIWGGHFGYLGSESSDIKDTGFIWLDFYDGWGVLAFFRPSEDRMGA